jgi:hypothetical protein
MNTIINEDPTTDTTTTSTSANATINVKDQLKALSVEDRYTLLNIINMEERNEYIRNQKQNAIEEEKKLAQCPVSKQVNLMKLEIQDLKIELQKIKNKTQNTNSNATQNTIKKCPYAMFRFEDFNQKQMQDTDDLCNEMAETYTSSFSWWSTIIFIVFILFVMTTKPSKHCELFTTL